MVLLSVLYFAVVCHASTLDDVYMAAVFNDIVGTVVPSLALTTRLSVSFVQPEWKFTLCGSNYSFPAKNTILNDTGVSYVKNSDVRSYRDVESGPLDYLNWFQYKPAMTWTAVPDANYTLLMVDPLLIHDIDHPLGPYVVHMAIVNIPGNDHSKGNVPVPYLGAGNEEATIPNKYTFLLYRQSAFITVEQTEILLSDGRLCNFDLTSFVSDLGLGSAVGINWMYSTADDSIGPYGKFQEEFLGVDVCGLDECDGMCADNTMCEDGVCKPNCRSDDACCSVGGGGCDMGTRACVGLFDKMCKDVLWDYQCVQEAELECGLVC